MTEKIQFAFKEEYITLNGGVFATARTKLDAELISKVINDLLEENQQLKKTLRIIADAESARESDNVKEILRDTLFGLDSVAGESFNAWNDYVLLNKFFKEYYDNEHWDNDKYD